MKITTNNNSTDSKRYEREDELPRGAMLLDADGDYVITNCDGQIGLIIDNDGAIVYPAANALWPLRDAPAGTKVTLTA